ncbi:MAG: hypothetical protein H0V82_02570 [Candidatus Protochlamydia sp.]|nr:hypothetical protein [Candidatus Protochlamydia sp.]
MQVQLDKVHGPNYMFMLNNECCAKAKEIKSKVDDILKRMAIEESNESISDWEARSHASDLIQLGVEGFAFELKEAYKSTPELKNLVKVLIKSNEYELSYLSYRKALEDLLQKKVIVH